jgi:acetoin utilization deacetylase AcuC-like enzyme
VGVLDLDIHYPNGTSAIVASMNDASLHSLHAWPVVNSPSGTARPATPRERLIEFSEAPTATEYLDAVAHSIDALSSSASVLVLSLGFDTVAGDPHGSWHFSPDIFLEIGLLLADCKRPVCVVQEGGYALDSLTDCSHAFVTGLLDRSGT